MRPAMKICRSLTRSIPCRATGISPWVKTVIPASTAVPGDHVRHPRVWLFRLSVRYFYANPGLGGLGAKPDHFLAAMGLAALERGLEGDAVACARRGVRNFRQCHYHLSALGHCCSPHDCELARITQCIGARAADTGWLLGLSGLFYFVAVFSDVVVMVASGI